MIHVFVPQQVVFLPEKQQNKTANPKDERFWISPQGRRTRIPNYAVKYGILFTRGPRGTIQLRWDAVAVQVATLNESGSPNTVSASGMPAGLAYDSSSGYIVGTISPDADLGSPYTITVTTTDNATGAQTNETIAWAVSQVTVTVTDPGSQANYEGDTVALNLSASDTGSHTLSYSVDTSTPLPNGLSIDQNTGTISGTISPGASVNSPYTLTVIATDSAANVSNTTTFAWTISQVTVGLTNPADQSNYDGDSVNLPLVASDSASSHLLTYSVSADTPLPSGLALDPNSGIISGSILPNTDTNSPFLVTVIATDTAADASASASFNWTISPVTVSLSSPADQSNFDGDQVALNLSATDSAGHPLFYSVDDSTPLPGGLTLDAFSGEVYGTIASNADINSPYSITVSAIDQRFSRFLRWSYLGNARNAVENPGFFRVNSG